MSHGHPRYMFLAVMSKGHKYCGQFHRLWFSSSTRINQYIPYTKQDKTEKKMMPILDEHEAAFFERSFRKQATSAPHDCGRERYFSSMLMEKT